MTATKRSPKSDEKESRGPRTRRSFVKSISGLLVGLFGATTLQNRSESRDIKAQSTNPYVTLGTRSLGFKTTSVYKQTLTETDISPTFLAIRGGVENFNQNQYFHILADMGGNELGTAALAGKNWTAGPGIVGESHSMFEDAMDNEPSGGVGVAGFGKTGVFGDGNSDGVHGEGETGVRGVAREDGEDGVRGEGRTGVRGVARDTGDGVRGDSPQGDGIRGDGRTGVRGVARADVDEIDDEDRAGVIGEAQGEEADGVRGENPDGDGIHGEGRTGVRGRSGTEDGEGVRGESAHGDGVRGDGRTGVRGKTDHAEGRGVLGLADGERADAVRGENPDGDGIHGEGRNGVHGRSVRERGTGVYGEATDSTGRGVRGENVTGIGVQGRGQVGIRGIASRLSEEDDQADRPLPDRAIAIEAIADEEDSIGIHARAEQDGAVALRVESTRERAVALDVRVPEGGTAIHIRGAACFDTVGHGRFARNSRSATVDDRRVTAGSFIYTMISGNPSSGNSPARVGVSWIERHPESGFTVHLDGQVQNETPFAYFIVEPCPSDEDNGAHG